VSEAGRSADCGGENEEFLFLKSLPIFNRLRRLFALLLLRLLLVETRLETAAVSCFFCFLVFRDPPLPINGGAIEIKLGLALGMR
jgi:hypothetical protein